MLRLQVIPQKSAKVLLTGEQYESTKQAPSWAITTYKDALIA